MWCRPLEDLRQLSYDSCALYSIFLYIKYYYNTTFKNWWWKYKNKEHYHPVGFLFLLLLVGIFCVYVYLSCLVPHLPLYLMPSVPYVHCQVFDLHAKLLHYFFSCSHVLSFIVFFVLVYCFHLSSLLPAPWQLHFTQFTVIPPNMTYSCRLTKPHSNVVSIGWKHD